MALRPDGGKIRVSVILTQEQRDALQVYGDRIGLGLSALMRMIVADWLEGKTHV